MESQVTISELMWSYDERSHDREHGEKKLQGYPSLAPALPSADVNIVNNDNANHNSGHITPSRIILHLLPVAKCILLNS
jgi:hypothetical protein